ncbi:MAG TPA: glycosyltransferase family A protein [Vicinamibacterales bacterium]|nr:glycosyltransferase family A protein [Vicinamibacterales bacterium]
MPSISVVVPAFNTATYIGATLESLGKQTFRDFEVIVVDDGSTDDTKSLASACIARLGLNGGVVSRPGNLPKGVASCRNHGVSQAVGTWIAFLDSDDLFEPNKLERVVGLLKAPGTSALALHHAVMPFDDATVEPAGAPEVGDGGRGTSSLDDLLTDNSIATSSVVVNRECFASLGGFDSRLNGVEDYWLWLRIAKRGEWSYLPEALTRYRLRRGSLMGGRSLTHYVDQYTKLLAIADRCNELSVAELGRLRRSIFSGPLRYYTSVAYQSGGLAVMLRGLCLLAFRGFPADSGRILYRQTRAIALGSAQRTTRRLGVSSRNLFS